MWSSHIIGSILSLCEPAKLTEENGAKITEDEPNEEMETEFEETRSITAGDAEEQSEMADIETAEAKPNQKYVIEQQEKVERCQ